MRRVWVALLLASSACRSACGFEEKELVEGGGGAGTGSVEGGGGNADGGAGGAAPCSPDLTIDAAHCGACNHDCLGGECIDSVCQPSIFNIGGMPQYIAFDSERVYWADYGAGVVLSRRKDGSDPQVLTGLSYQMPVDLVVDEGFLYIVGYDHGAPGGISRVPLGQGPNQALQTLVVDLSGPWRIATDGEQLFYTTRFSDEIVSRVSMNGTDQVPVAESTNGGVEPLGIAVDDAHVYWAEWSTGLLRRAPKTGGGPSPETLVTGQTGIRGLALDDDSVFWGTSTAIFNAPKTDFSEPVLVADIPATHIVVEGEYLYYSTGSAFGRIRKDGTGHHVYAADLPDLQPIAVDADAVYASSTTGNVIWRVRKD